MFNYKNVLIYGYAASGKAVERILIDKDVNYKIYDDNMHLGGGKYLFQLKKSDIKKFDLIVISPAVSIFNKLIMFAESEGIRVISELEFGFLFCPYPIIAVTGTNGKTTVVKMLEHVLNLSGLKVKALGNVGEPLSEVVNYKKLDYVVCEVSSFQLEATYKFKPNIGVILNVDQDHIDRHKTFNNYLNLKLSLFKNCNLENYAVINNQSEIVNGIATNAVNKVVLNKNCVLNKDYIMFNNEKVCHIKDLNYSTYLSNVLAVVSVLKLIGVENEKIVMGINTFKNLSHRLEFVDKVNNVEYYNDSKATNPHATLGAVNLLKSDKNITLLLGGQDKDFDFNGLIEKMPNNIKTIIAFGSARKKIFKASKLKINTLVCSNLKTAFLTAVKQTKSGGVVLLSPACASFDEFSGYAERGKFFKELVNELKIINYNSDSCGEVC